jgi:two-component system response regulator GlrR
MFPLLRKTRVLMLDDDAAMQRLVSLLLKRAGYRVEVFSSGNDAIGAIEQNDYGAILVDLMMPLEGGATVIRHLRETAPELLRRVIVVTGAPDTVTRAVAGEVAAVVRKPFDGHELVENVDRVAK